MIIRNQNSDLKLSFLDDYVEQEKSNILSYYWYSNKPLYWSLNISYCKIDETFFFQEKDASFSLGIDTIWKMNENSFSILTNNIWGSSITLKEIQTNVLQGQNIKINSVQSYIDRISCNTFSAGELKVNKISTNTCFCTNFHIYQNNTDIFTNIEANNIHCNANTQVNDFKIKESKDCSIYINTPNNSILIPQFRYQNVYYNDTVPCEYFYNQDEFGISNVHTFFIKKDSSTYVEEKDVIQIFVYSPNRKTVIGYATIIIPSWDSLNILYQDSCIGFKFDNLFFGVGLIEWKDGNRYVGIKAPNNEAWTIYTRYLGNLDIGDFTTEVDESIEDNSNPSFYYIDGYTLYIINSTAKKFKVTFNIKNVPTTGTTWIDPYTEWNQKNIESFTIYNEKDEEIGINWNKNNVTYSTLDDMIEITGSLDMDTGVTIKNNSEFLITYSSGIIYPGNKCNFKKNVTLQANVLNNTFIKELNKLVSYYIDGYRPTIRNIGGVSLTIVYDVLNGTTNQTDTININETWDTYEVTSFKIYYGEKLLATWDASETPLIDDLISTFGNFNDSDDFEITSKATNKYVIHVNWETLDQENGEWSSGHHILYPGESSSFSAGTYGGRLEIYAQCGNYKTSKEEVYAG